MRTPRVVFVQVSDCFQLSRHPFLLHHSFSFYFFLHKLFSWPHESSHWWFLNGFLLWFKICLMFMIGYKNGCEGCDVCVLAVVVFLPLVVFTWPHESSHWWFLNGFLLWVKKCLMLIIGCKNGCEGCDVCV